MLCEGGADAGLVSLGNRGRMIAFKCISRAAPSYRWHANDYSCSFVQFVVPKKIPGVAGLSSVQLVEFFRR